MTPNLRQHAAAALVLAILTLTAAHRLAFSDWIMARGDTYSYHYPYWQTRADALRGGDDAPGVLWTDKLFGGAPLLANPQVGVFYPPNIALTALDAPDAIRVSVLIHLMWAGVGGYVLARGALRVGWLAGVVGGGAFLLGGHLGAHVEQINQLQGLSWLPWALWAFDRALVPAPNRRRHSVGLAARWGMILSLLLALQFFSGHTQTVFLTGAALGIYALCTRPVRGLLTLVFAGVITALLAAPQLLPTLALSRLGNRESGFTLQGATAFSFSPFAVGRGLLPSFDRMIFSEYIAYPGIIVGALAWIGAFTATPVGDIPPTPLSGGRKTARTGGRRAVRALAWLARLMQRPAAPWIALVVTGLFLAFGIYNPFYALFYNLPGFNLFRVPARWLVLLAMGAAMLAALGVESLRQRRARLLTLIPYAAIIAGLVLLAPQIVRTIDGTPAYPAENSTMIGWIAASALMLIGSILTRIERTARFAVPLLAIAAAAELLIASGALAYNQVLPPDSFSAERFSISQLQAYLDAETDPTVSSRLLSMSDLLFDPGDRAALERRYDALGISGEARALAFDTVKLREVVGGNLPLLWGIPSFDGFDGGLLPTRAYSAFTSLMLPDGELRTLDGRLRESLYNDACGGACIPDQRWLDLAGIRYLLVDKVYDLVRDGVFFDTTFPRSTQTVYFNPTGFAARSVDVLYTCVTGNQMCASPGLMVDGVGQVPEIRGEPLDRYLFARYSFGAPHDPALLEFYPGMNGIVRAVSLVADPDAASPVFAQLAPSPYRRLLSSDIKLYENTTVLPRAFVVTSARCAGDDAFGDEFALSAMREPSFDPARQAMIAGDSDGCALNSDNTGSLLTALITAYAPESLTVRVETDNPAFLIVANSYDPGWRATVDGVPVPIDRANVLFQAVRLSASAAPQMVRLTYDPPEVRIGLVIGALAWALGVGFLLTAGLAKFMRRRSESAAE